MYKWMLTGMLLCAGMGAVYGQRKPVVAKAKPAAANSKPVPVKTAIKATYTVDKKKVLIRWAPTNEEGWRLGNKYGYIFERRTIVRDGKILGGGNGYFSYLIHKPDSLQEWLPAIDSNNNAAVMAQALYGDNFELDINKRGTSNPRASLLGRVEENKQRYVFAMYAADNDFRVAEFAGLGFVDSAVKPNEKYFYRIYPAAPKSLVKADTALLFVSLSDTIILPKPSEILTEGSNNSVLLNWDMGRTKAWYNTFNIQRSADGGKTFEPITKEPYTSFNQGANPQLPNSILYADTTVEREKRYLYRISGNTIFNTTGPWSATAEGHSLPLLEGVPGIQGIRFNTENNPVVDWYFEDSIRPKVKNFELTYAPTQEGPFTVAVDNIPATASKVAIPANMPAGYLVMKAVSKEGISRTSFPWLYQPEDSIPPAVPTGLTATIDSTGKVVLKWLPNSEKDLAGYKVFRTMIKGGEPAILVDTVWKATSFTDTVSLKLINRNVYYTVSALDFINNQSAMSAAVQVVKPDIIPPSSPVFADYQLKEGAISINWINSIDEDVVTNMLYRKEGDKGDWKLLSSSKTARQFTDTTVRPEKMYVYKLVAKDSSGLVSGEAQQLRLTALPINNRKLALQLDAEVDRDKRLIYLRWKPSARTTITSYEIFKGDDKNPMSLFKVLDAKYVDMLDNELTINTKYKYGIRAVFANGQYSEFITKEVIY